MKIGDAGEAFFVFETEEDIPEDLVTSPLLSPTPEPGELQGDFEHETFGAKPGGEEKSDLSLQMQEPEFLDLNASSVLKHPIPIHAGAQPKLGSRSVPHTPPPEDPVVQPTDVSGPEVQYKAGACVLHTIFDMILKALQMSRLIWMDIILLKYATRLPHVYLVSFM